MLSEKIRSPPASQSRKMTKSVMEKKRRARINTSLSELKSILGGIISHRGERFDKMEKADILEMTVNYVRQLQSGINKDTRTNTTDDEFKSGVNSCISEVIKYVASNDLCDTDVKTKLLDHLADKITGTKASDCMTTCLQTSEPVSSSMISPCSADLSTSSIELDCNNNVQSVQHHLPDSSTSGEQMSPTQLTSVTSLTQLAPTPLVQQSFLPVRPMPIMPANSQGPAVLSNIPLAIVVPANLYSPTSTGTACVFAIPSSGQPQPTLVSSSSPSQDVLKENGVPQIVAPSVISPHLLQSIIPQQKLIPDSIEIQTAKGSPTDTQDLNFSISCSTTTGVPSVLTSPGVTTQSAFICPTSVTSQQMEISSTLTVPYQTESILTPVKPLDSESDKVKHVQSNVVEFTPTFHKKYRRHLAETKRPVWRPW